jgi:hypothetical protein
MYAIFLPRYSGDEFLGVFASEAEAYAARNKLLAELPERDRKHYQFIIRPVTVGVALRPFDF